MCEHNLSKEQIDAILKLDPKSRYKHAIKQIVGWGELWGLGRDEEWLLIDGEGEKFFPIWPAKEYAAMCAVGDWESFVEESIDLDFFLESVLPSLDEKGIRVLVFKTPNDRGMPVFLKNLKHDFFEELENY